MLASIIIYHDIGTMSYYDNKINILHYDDGGAIKTCHHTLDRDEVEWLRQQKQKK